MLYQWHYRLSYFWAVSYSFFRRNLADSLACLDVKRVLSLMSYFTNLSAYFDAISVVAQTLILCAISYSCCNAIFIWYPGLFGRKACLIIHALVYQLVNLFLALYHWRCKPTFLCVKWSISYSCFNASFSWQPGLFGRAVCLIIDVLVYPLVNLFWHHISGSTNLPKRTRSYSSFWRNISWLLKGMGILPAIR